MLAQAARARIAITTKKTSKTACVVEEELVASVEAAAMKTIPKMMTKSATKAAKARRYLFFLVADGPHHGRNQQ